MKRTRSSDASTFHYGVPKDELIRFGSLRKESFILGEGSDPTIAFPLRWMFSTTKLLNFRTGLLALDDGEELQSRLDELIRVFTDYRIPVVTLLELTVDEVCPIFERINKSGTQLSIYDLMVAATWHRNFHLDAEVANIQAALDRKGFSDIPAETILKCLSAVELGGFRKNQIIALRDIERVRLEALVRRTEEALRRTVDTLFTEFLVYSWAFLPYEAMAIVLCYLHSRIPDLSGERVRRVRQWFWRAAFSERYRVGGEAFVSNDLETVRQYVEVSTGSPETFGSPPTIREWFRSAFRANNSRSRAFILSLAAAGPRNLTNGSKIDTADALSTFNRKQFHHIYPRAHLERQRPPVDPNRLLNICMLAAAENVRVSDSDPNVYLPELTSGLGEEASAVFTSNLLPPPNAVDYATLDYLEFLRLRLVIVVAVSHRLCAGLALDMNSLDYRANSQWSSSSLFEDLVRIFHDGELAVEAAVPEPPDADAPVAQPAPETR